MHPGLPGEANYCAADTCWVFTAVWGNVQFGDITDSATRPRPNGASPARDVTHWPLSVAAWRVSSVVIFIVFWGKKITTLHQSEACRTFTLVFKFLLLCEGDSSLVKVSGGWGGRRVRRIAGEARLTCYTGIMTHRCRSFYHFVKEIRLEVFLVYWSEKNKKRIVGKSKIFSYTEIKVPSSWLHEKLNLTV